MARPLKPLIRSGGFYPSRKWTPLVYAGGYTTENGGEEPAPPPIEKTVIGNPIHITDALAKPVQALSVKLEPIQDLHGYENPWPSGGGVNKLPTLSAYDSTYNGIRIQIDNEGKVRLSGTSTEAAYFTFDIPEITLPSTDIYIHLMNSWANSSVGIFFLFDNTSIAGLTAGSLNRIYKSDALTGATINKVQYYVSSGQTVDMTLSPMLCLDGTAKAFSPYSNICPISGHTSADVTRTGVNVWDEEAEQGTLSTVNGSDVVKTTRIRSKNYIPVVPNNKYYFRIGSAGVANGLLACFYDAGKNFISAAWQSFAMITMPSNTYYVRFSTGDAYGGTYNHDISINYPSTDTDYHAYVGTTYPIPLGQTVYGGTLDVVNGVLTVDRAMVTLTSDMAWQYSAGTQRFFVAVSGAASGSGDTPFHGSCNVFKAGTGTEDNAVSYVNTSFYGFAVKYPAANGDMTAWKQFLSDNTVSVVYPLATPQTIQLTPQQVELLQGENNIWSDGEMTLVYLADGNASDEEALNILLGGRYVNNHGEDEPTDREALDIVLGGKK